MRRFVAECATEERYQLAEGPVWDADGQRVLWVDIPAGDVHFGALRGSTIVATDSVHVDSTASAVALAEDDGLVVAGHRSVYLVDTAGAPAEVARLVPSAQERRLNDGKCDPAGRFLVGTLSLGPDVHESLYCVDATRGVQVVDDDLQLSNGLAWSPDGTTMYSVDTLPGIVWQRSYDPRTGARGKREQLLHLTDGMPDGMCVDAEGDLWVAVWGGGEVRHFSPRGEQLGVVTVPAPHTSSVAFVGPDLGTLVITTAWDDLSEDQRASYPQSGALFMADVGVHGLPPARWHRGDDSRAEWPMLPTAEQ